jgi:hypothetical protein
MEYVLYPDSISFPSLADALAALEGAPSINAQVRRGDVLVARKAAKTRAEFEADPSRIERA